MNRRDGSKEISCRFKFAIQTTAQLFAALITYKIQRARELQAEKGEDTQGAKAAKDEKN
jgi:hypothetical protein